MSMVAPSSTYPYRGDPTYPTSDGKPMAETGIHVVLMLDLLGTLMRRLDPDPMAYAGANMFLYYVEGDKRRVVSPDVFVTLGVPKEPQRVNYIVWQEGKPPDVIIELTSKSTRNVDRKKKKALYQDVLKIPEYFLFDPTEDYLKPSLQGYRLVNGLYEPITLVNGRMHCDVLGLDLGREGKMLRLYDAVTGAKLLNGDETYRLAEERNHRAIQERRRANREKRQAEQERERAEQADQRAEQERERAEQERERAKQAGQRAEQERQRAEQADQRAEQERERADQADQRAEAEKVRTELERERAEAEKLKAEQSAAEVRRLMREIEELRRKAGDS